MNYLEETVKNKIKQYREFETQIEIDWGGKKRLFKCGESVRLLVPIIAA